MYFHSPCLLGDMSSSQNLDTASVDERILAILETRDPMIVDDLRHHNRGQPRTSSFGRRLGSTWKRRWRPL